MLRYVQLAKDNLKSSIVSEHNTTGSKTYELAFDFSDIMVTFEVFNRSKQNHFGSKKVKSLKIEIIS